MAESKGERTRRRILAATAHEFAVGGYVGTHLRAVADAADLKLPSLYFHFASKDELVLATLAEAIDFALHRVDEAVETAGPDADAVDRLRAAMDAQLRALHDSPDRGVAVANMATTLPPDLREEFHVHERRYARRWRELLADAQADGAVAPGLDLGVTRDLVLGAMNGTVGRLTRRRITPTVDTLMALVTAARAA